MMACFGASPARASGGQMSHKVADANHVSLGAQSSNGVNRRGLTGHVRRHSQDLRERPLPAVPGSGVAPHSHRRRWSADFSQRGISPLITVTKNKKEPQPPQRGASLLQSNPTSHPSSKRYSCPAIGGFQSPSRLSSSSSSSCSTCSCSSPPPVQTSVITGPDPLGWKLRPKSGSVSGRARANRLSLQIPLPVVCPEPKTRSAPISQSDCTPTPTPDPSPRTKPPLKPKPSRRHSDSSALLRSLGNHLPMVTLEDLCDVHLRRFTLSDESDDVFGGRNEEEAKPTKRQRKIPPPVPEKTFMARQIAQLIAHSRKRCKTTEDNIYASVIKPKPTHPNTEDHRSLHDRNTELRVDTGCDRERTTPRFPG